MTSFRFLHAADIHLDSPLYGLSRYDGLPVEDIRSATRAAFDNLIQLAIDELVDFVIIAGDLFDGDWKDMGTGLYFARAMGRLNQAGIPAFVLAGNHDAESSITRTVPWPPNVRQFTSRRPETHLLPDLGVAIHGQSFATSAVTDNLALAYPSAVDRAFNIGVLHTALAGRPGHHAYAPCSVDDLRARGYQYWALGHVHEFEIACTDPYVVFPGNIQGRTIRETGAKGAVLVTVGDGEVAKAERVELDVIRWVHVDVDCAGLAFDAVAEHVRSALARTYGAQSSGHPLVARVTLTGEMHDAGKLHDRAASLRDDVRAIASSISADLHIEKVRANVVPIATKSSSAIGEDLSTLIEEGAHDLSLLEALSKDLERFLVAADAALGNLGDGQLRQLAKQGDWSAVAQHAAIALGSRLGTEA